MIEDYILQMFQENPRRPNVVYSIIIGRNTVSNIYWGMRYNLLDYFGMDPQFSNTLFRENIAKLQKNKLLEENDIGIKLTSLGLEQKKKLKKSLYQVKHPKLMNRYRFNEWSETLILAIQVISELSFTNRHYYPIVTSELTKFNIKRWLSNNGKEKLVNHVHSELELFIKELDTNAELIFMNKLIGHQLNGLTNKQLAIELTLSEIETDLMYRDTMNYFASWIEKQEQSVFKELVQLIQTKGIISESAQDTMKYINSGLSVNDIAKKRQLKKSTINEHLLELAMFDDKFPYQLFLTSELVGILTKIIGGNIDQYSFQEIQEKIPEINFFDYRLYQIYRSKNG
ncbi:helix-turn-helix domain-containing protein [Dellaglioa carnosa]|uniref:helix-turn-helix domain-containing protein n=1 Tax=Dellaglioa carnosa TaxID=2995136 RepID=UPI0022A888C9|nr:helix-turn-helix domain-containing protein [Dellaglioa carnosa]MCZ2492558.1 helix-turn-helix domain-containing protein [Dellaglioa carnosa]